MMWVLVSGGSYVLLWAGIVTAWLCLQAQGVVLAANLDPRASGHSAPSVMEVGSGASVGCRTASSPAFHAEA